MSYERFLGSVSSEVLPYLGGPFVEATDRRLRLAAPVERGYWRFEVRGRQARALEPAEPPDLDGLPAVRGLFVAGYVAGDGGSAQRLAIGPPDEPLLFTPVVARRWPTGALLFDTYDFESGIEETVREAYEARRPIGDLRGVPASLRAAYGYAVVLRMAGELSIPARPAEVRGRLRELADGGDDAARRILTAARARREDETAARRRVPESGSSWVPTRGQVRHEHAEERAAAVLDAAGAALRGTRWLAGGLLEVRYDLRGEMFVSIVDGANLRVVDAGICLDGTDQVLNLTSLPGVILQAMRLGVLNVTAW